MLREEVVIVLINYNSHQDSVDCLNSIMACDMCNLPYVIVVDNNSVEKCIGDVLSFYPKLKVVFSDKNLGFGKANNLAIEWINKNINCDFVFLLNNDTIIVENTINNLKHAIKTNKDVALTTPMIKVYSNPTEIWYSGGFMNYKKMCPIINDMDPNTEQVTEFASGCAMFFRKDVLSKLGGFDPFFFMYDEDVDLSLRIQEIGLKILYVPDSLVYHKCQGSQGFDTNKIPSNQLDPNHPGLLFYLKNTIPNRFYIINKHLEGYKKYKALVYQYIYWSLKSLQYLINNKPRAFSLTIRLLVH